MKQATLIPKDDDIIDLRGTVERIVFHNEENGYTVFRFRPESQKDDEMITAVGYMASPQGGMMLHLRGKWVNNPRFGRQFQMTFSEETRPSSLEGITLYLSSGLIKGIGKTLAARIVEKFGKKPWMFWIRNLNACSMLKALVPKSSKPSFNAGTSTWASAN